MNFYSVENLTRQNYTVPRGWGKSVTSNWDGLSAIYAIALTSNRLSSAYPEARQVGVMDASFFLDFASPANVRPTDERRKVFRRCALLR